MTCSRDTDGDGNCGQRYCPECGQLKETTMKADTRYFWLTERAKFDDLPVHHAFDILRYDGARVEANAPDGYYLFSSDGRYAGPNVDRLRSYHVEPVWSSGRVEPDYGRSQAMAWFHRQ